MKDQISSAEYQRLQKGAGKKQKKANPEHELQCACVRWFAKEYPALWLAKRLHAVPNGGYRTPKAANAMRAEGQMPGVWDLHLTIPASGYCGLWIESKAGKNGLSTHQAAFQIEHEGIYEFAIVRTLQDFQQAIKNYLPPKSSFVYPFRGF